METSRKCDICKIIVHIASFAKRFRSTKHEELSKFIPSDFYNERKKIKPKKLFNSKPLKNLGRETFKIDVKQLNQEFF